MASEKQFNITVEKDVIDRLDKIAASSHLGKASKLAPMALSILSQIEPQLFLSAIGEINAKYGRRAGPGRPPTGPRLAGHDAAQAA